MRMFPKHDFTKGMVKMEFKQASEVEIKEARKFSSRTGKRPKPKEQKEKEERKRDNKKRRIVTKIIKIVNNTRWW